MQHDDSAGFQSHSNIRGIKVPREDTCKFAGEEISRDILKEYGKALDRYFSILKEWDQEDGL